MMQILMYMYFIIFEYAQVISVYSEYSASFIVQWGVHCLPEDGKFKSLEVLSAADPTKVEMLLGQLTSAGGELKLL
jgi:Mediator complex subunit 24 N-terminal